MYEIYESGTNAGNWGRIILYYCRQGSAISDDHEHWSTREETRAPPRRDALPPFFLALLLPSPTPNYS